MDVLVLIDRLEELVEEARSFPGFGNTAMVDRDAAFGMRLDVPAGTAVRFEPGDEHEVTLVELGGRRRVFGLNRLTEGDAIAGSR